jgi:uncharacterized protein YcbX
MTSATVAAIHRYPVKGLSPERLPLVTLQRGRTLPADRRYAIENGPSGFDPSHPVWKAKTYYLMLMRNERLAALRTHYDDASHTLTIRANDIEVARGDLSTAEGRKAIEDYFARHFADELRGPPKVLQAENYSFSDVAKKVVSLINLESVAAVSDMFGGAAVDPLRFRGNLHVSGWPAWREFDLMGQTLAIGTARLKVVKRIVRCAAVNVDPATAARNLDIPKALMRHLGHMDCGVYAEVIGDGEVTDGDDIVVEAMRLL